MQFAAQTRNVFFVVCFIFANAYLVKEANSIAGLWTSFKFLKDGDKFALTLCVISATYFATAMCFEESKEDEVAISSSPPSGPAKSPSKKSAMSFFTAPSGFLTESPALSDATVDFELPKDLPESDRELFEYMFDK